MKFELLRPNWLRNSADDSSKAEWNGYTLWRRGKCWGVYLPGVGLPIASGKSDTLFDALRDPEDWVLAISRTASELKRVIGLAFQDDELADRIHQSFEDIQALPAEASRVTQADEAA